MTRFAFPVCVDPVQIILPLVRADLERFIRLQLPSLERFYEDLGEVWVITRPEDVRVMQQAVGGVCIVTDERALVPEVKLQWDPRPHRARRRRTEPTNWYFQQLVKLAAVASIPDDFALVLDGDVFAVRPFGDHDLVHEGRALRPHEPSVIYPEWLADAAETLGVPAIDYQAAVTPYESPGVVGFGSTAR